MPAIWYASWTARSPPPAPVTQWAVVSHSHMPMPPPHFWPPLRWTRYICTSAFEMLSDTNIQIQEGRGGDPLCRPNSAREISRVSCCMSYVESKVLGMSLRESFKGLGIGIGSTLFSVIQQWVHMKRQVCDTFRISGFECPPNFVCKSIHPSFSLPYFDPLVNSNGRQWEWKEGRERGTLHL